MHLWEGLFRARSADSPGNSPTAAQLSGAGPDIPPLTSNSTTANPRQQSWHPVATANGSDSGRQYQQQFSRSSPDLAATATARNHGSSSSSQPVQIPESKVLPYSRLLARSASSISPSPTQNILADSPGTEVLLGLHHAAAAAAAAATSSSNGSSTQPQQQNSNLILRAQNRNKRPPLAPSPQAKPQHLSNAAAAGSSSSSNAPISPRRGGIASQLTATGSNSSAAAAAAWIPRVPSNSSLAAPYSSPIGSSSSSGPRNDTSRVLASSGSTGSRKHQQLLQNALHSGSPSPTTEGLLASSLQLSPRAAAAAAAVGEAVAAVAGNPYHPHHQHTMQLLVQHQQLQMHQLQQQQSGLSAAAAGSVAGSVDGYLNPVGDYYGERSAVQQSPQSPRVLSRCNSSSSRLAELGTSPGLIEASFMGMAARPSRKLTHSHSFTAGSSSSRRRALQQMQHAEHLAARQQQEQQQRAFGSRGGSAANSPRGSQSGSGASLADWDSNNVMFGFTDHVRSTAAAASAQDPGVQSEVPDQIGSNNSSRDLEQLLTRHWAGRGSNPSSSAASTPMLYDRRYDTCYDTGNRGGMRVLPGQQGLTWISRADDGESAARGLLGLPRPGMPSSPSSRDQQQQQQGLGRSVGFGARSSGSVSEIEAHDTDQGAGEVLFSGFGGHRRISDQQQQQGRGTIQGGLIRRSASYGELMATPAKIGARSSGTAAAGSVSNGQPVGSAAIPAANGGSSSSNGQLPYTAQRASFKRVAAAIAAAPASSPTSSAAAAAAAAAAEDDEEPLRRQDSFNSYTSGRSADSNHTFGTSPGYLAATAAAGDYRSGTAGSARPSPRTSPRAAAAARYMPNGSSSSYFSRSFTRIGSNTWGVSLGRIPSTAGFPTCLICLDQLTPDDFECGEALQLDCRCKGEVALRHRSCAEKWSRIKGNTICDVCKAPILNLPDVPPLPVPPGQGAGNPAATLLNESGLWGSEEPAAGADYVFDCMRVTWVVLIVCILFLELSVSRSFLTGALIGSAYVAVAASWSAAQRRRRQNRLAAAAAAAGWMGGQGPGLQEQRVPLLQGQVGGIEGLPV